MKRCNKCEIEYANDINFCKKCGTALEKLKKVTEKSEKKKKEICNLIRYIFGIIIALGSIGDLMKLKIYGLFGMLFGLSLLPIIYDKIFEIKKVKDTKFKKTIQIVIPIILGLLWGIFLPSE